MDAARVSDDLTDKAPSHISSTVPSSMSTHNSPSTTSLHRSFSVRGMLQAGMTLVPRQLGLGNQTTLTSSMKAKPLRRTRLSESNNDTHKNVLEGEDGEEDVHVVEEDEELISPNASFGSKNGNLFHSQLEKVSIFVHYYSLALKCMVSVIMIYLGWLTGGLYGALVWSVMIVCFLAIFPLINNVSNDGWIVTQKATKVL